MASNSSAYTWPACSVGCLVQVLLHDPRDRPLMLERGFKVSPGFVTQVAVTPTYVSCVEQ